MVDELIRYSSKRPFHNGSCHMTTDGPIEELHVFADKIGLKRQWFQKHKIVDHYDLTPKMRAKAIAAGAVEVGWRDQAMARRAKQKAAAVDLAVDAAERRTPLPAESTKQTGIGPRRPVCSGWEGTK